jgi:hypothetical protein
VPLNERIQHPDHVRILCGIVLAGLVLVVFSLVAVASAQPVTGLRFQISVAGGLGTVPQGGRLLVVLDPLAGHEPRLRAAQTEPDEPVVLARDVKDFGVGNEGILDSNGVTFPISDLARLSPATYWVQAVFDGNRDVRPTPDTGLDTPGTLYSLPRSIQLDPAHPQTVRLELSRRVPDDALPADTDRLRFIRLQSRLLSAFHGRPIFLRAGIRLPPAYATEPSRHFPLRVHIGGFGSRYFNFPPDAPAGDDTVLLVLDGIGPLGDPYQVDSANNGPYGRALTRELIPYVERHFRCIGKPYARVLDGNSTGGWVSLALQVFYPDYFNGAWAFAPDPVDFRSLQLINIYRDNNAYVNKDGSERSGMRNTDGTTRESMRHQCQIENVLGRGDSWVNSGQQWGTWNAVFGPRGNDGKPVPLWDPKTGVINHQAAEHWKRYDLRLILEQNWPRLEPKLHGKLHIWVGEADDYYLNDAVHRLDAFLTKAQPPYGGTLVYGQGHNHFWRGITEQQMIEQMLEAVR